MTDQQTRKLNAAEAGLDTIDAHNATWSGSTIYKDERDLLEATIDSIESVAQLQETDITGIAGDKRSIKEQMIAVAIKLCRPILVFARKHNNNQLKEEIDFTKTDLERASDADLLSNGGIIADRATANLADLTAEGYPVAPADITLLESLLVAYDDKQAAPRAARDNREQLTEQLKKKFKDLDGIIDNLKDLSDGFGADFAALVKEGFQIDDSGVRKLSLEVRVYDEVTDVPLRNAVVRIVELNLSKKTSRIGRAGFLSVPNGNYKIEITYPGYALQVLENIGVQQGVIKRLYVKLRKE